ncbi:keratin, type II cytoskeletal 3-like [Protopterus annectens]|uniref:keratin, type II cytoskeletal 3-like n=1 Tax=Protopterus annectens TaxID=7888 RepID=UPI001CFA67C4|nr:keratin, type II cytoskeletal 3-like [Protopterus annectens]
MNLNVSNNELAFIQLLNECQIRVMAPDKGGGLILMGNFEYENKMLEYLNTGPYILSSINEVNIANKKIREMLDELFLEEIIDYDLLYEDEINNRTAAENESMTLKKHDGAAFLQKSKQEAKLNGLWDEINFIRKSYNEELEQMNLYVKDVTAITEVDNRQDFEMNASLETLKAQYDDIIKHSRVEAHTLYQRKYEELVTSANCYGDNIRNTKTKIQEMKRNIPRLRNEIENLKQQNANLETAFAETEEHGETAVKDARLKLAEKEAALQKAKENMARLTHDYQKLMKVKISLDIEMTFYGKLLEE